jgi:hypothetical protein
VAGFAMPPIRGWRIQILDAYWDLAGDLEK